MSEPPIDRRYEDAAERQALEADNERLREAIYWALGERDEFPEEPPPLNGKWRQRYWWRRELRRRAFDVDDNGADQPRPLTSDERAALDRAFERSITVIHPGIDATGDQPVICTHDGSTVPDDSGGWFCADCGYVSSASQPSPAPCTRCHCHDRAMEALGDPRIGVGMTADNGGAR